MKECRRWCHDAVRIVGSIMAVAVLTMEGCAVTSNQDGASSAPAMTAPVLALYNDGVGAGQAQEWEKAGEMFQAALDRARVLGDEAGISASLLALGGLYAELQEYPRALESLSLALGILAKGKQPQHLASEGLTRVFIGWVHAQMGNNAKAMAAFVRGVNILEKALANASDQEKSAILPQRANLLLMKAGAEAKFEEWPAAVESYRQAAADFKAVRNLEKAGHALGEAAKITLQSIHLPQQAVGLYSEASSLLEEAGHIADATRARLGSGWSSLAIGNVKEAAEVFAEVTRVANREGLDDLVVPGLVGLGISLEGLAEFEQALTIYQAALQRLRVIESEGKSILELKILIHKGNVHRLLSQYEEAVEAFHAAAVKSREAQDANSEAEALTLLAQVYAWLGDFKTAIQYDKQALERFQALDNQPKQVELLAALGETGWLSDEISAEEADQYLWEGKRILGSLKGTDPLALLNEANQGKTLSTEETRQLFEAWQKTVPSLHLDYRRAGGTLYQSWGRVLLQDGKLKEALSSLQIASIYHASLPANRDTTWEQGKDLFFLAESYRRKGELNLALQHFHAAAERAALLRTPEVHWIYAGLARTYADLGDTENAVRHYQMGLEILEFVQTQQAIDESKIGLQGGARYVYQGFVALLLDLYRRTSEEGYLRAAFQQTERGRARAFLDMLTMSRATRLGGEVGGLAQKGEETHRAMARIYHQLRAPQLDKTEESRLLDQLEQVRARARTWQQEAAQQSPRYAQLISPRPLAVDEVQSALDADAVLLEYAIEVHHSTLWVMTKEQVHAFSLPSLDQLPALEQFLKTLREPLIGPEELAHHLALGQDLYRALLSPAEPYIHGKKHLIIVPDGQLYYLPFEALTIPQPQGRAQKPSTLADAPYLVKQFRVTYAPSASIMVAQRRVRGNPAQTAKFPLLAFGDPVYREGSVSEGSETSAGRVGKLQLRGVRLNRLKFAGDEVRRIAEIWRLPLNSPHINLRDRASVERVRALDLTQYRRLHFATHAVLGDQVRWATQPALVLSQDVGEGKADGLLQFADILHWKLNADLVVLSACETGLGRLRQGEGIVGLTRAFLYAGASAVVVSLWKVEDQSTALLMERFYRRLKQGMSKAEALRQAKLELLRTTINMQAVGKRQSLASPFYWAPFILVGEWD